MGQPLVVFAVQHLCIVVPLLCAIGIARIANDGQAVDVPRDAGGNR